MAEATMVIEARKGFMRAPLQLDDRVDGTPAHEGATQGTLIADYAHRLVCGGYPDTCGCDRPVASFALLPSEPILYENQQPERLADETERFEAARIQVGTAPGPAFDHLAEGGEPLLYVVSRAVVLTVCEYVLDAHHSVLANGDLVIAAGELSLAVYGTEKIVLQLNAQSGHYRPQRNCVSFPADILRGLGFHVPEDLLDS